MSHQYSVDDYDEDIEEQIPTVALEEGFNHIIVVDNIPIVAPDKYKRLMEIIEPFYSQIGTIRDIVMPKEDGKTKGYCFIEFTSASHAAAAVAKTNGYKLDKNHVFKVNLFNDFEKYEKFKEEYQPPEPMEYKEQEHLQYWLLDPMGCDQYALKYGDETEIWWNPEPGGKPRLETKKTNWTDSFIAWSPLGTYLVTLHRLGVILWGGPNWDKIQKLPHEGVNLIDFSPNERYLITYSSFKAEKDDPKDPQSFFVWDTRTGAKLRGFPNENNDPQDKSNNPGWPVFKWSHDDKYLSKLKQGAIAIFETPSITLLDKKSLMLRSPVKEYAWSKTDHLISTWLPEGPNHPAQALIISIPSRKTVAQKNLFNVNECKMDWHPDGHYLCVKVDRSVKSKEKTTNFEFFRIREKEVPVESLEIPDSVIAFSWEPKGHRFALIHGSDSLRPSVSFYTMNVPKSMSQKLKRLKEPLDKRAANHLFWSPMGRFIVLAGLDSMNGSLEFFDVEEMETMATESHPMASAVEWDPTGRYVTTYVSFWRNQVENGFHIWSFQGQSLQYELKEKLYSFIWRPRPKSLLSAKQEKYLESNFKVFSKKYTEEDKKKREEQIQTELAKKRKLVLEWRKYMDEKIKEYKAAAPRRKEIRGYSSDSETTLSEEWVEEVIEQQEFVES
eukprot:TRINITY_DN6582_c0_g1_i1.p1 TRINITY_DN6582_c0_g1~~TRINITY_DN6582_c0_g1_i1.p1  ORF type:complete len:668 (+),score=165.09 TRINITY_DN6582_c0_g1_i1:58-2061(+)